MKKSQYEIMGSRNLSIRFYKTRSFFANHTGRDKTAFLQDSLRSRIVRIGFRFYARYARLLHCPVNDCIDRFGGVAFSAKLFGYPVSDLNRTICVQSP